MAACVVSIFFHNVYQHEFLRGHQSSKLESDQADGKEGAHVPSQPPSAERYGPILPNQCSPVRVPAYNTQFSLTRLKTSINAFRYNVNDRRAWSSHTARPWQGWAKATPANPSLFRPDKPVKLNLDWRLIFSSNLHKASKSLISSVKLVPD